jgi:hypothetical protein
MPGDNARWTPRMCPSDGHVGLWHLSPRAVGADGRDVQPEVGGYVRGGPPLLRRVRLIAHPAIVADPMTRGGHVQACPLSVPPSPGVPDCS